MISLEHFGDLLTRDIGPFAPKPTSIEGDQQEASETLWTSPDGGMETGIWECTPGRFTADRTEIAEICHILTGRVTLHDGDGTRRDIGPGEMFALPHGWRGEWTIHERTRKIYTMIAKGV
jgi:uncharacterized cupin superfamily protein